MVSRKYFVDQQESPVFTASTPPKVKHHFIQGQRFLMGMKIYGVSLNSSQEDLGIYQGLKASPWAL